MNSKSLILVKNKNYLILMNNMINLFLQQVQASLTPSVVMKSIKQMKVPPVALKMHSKTNKITWLVKIKIKLH